MIKAKVNTDTVRLILAGLVVGFVVALPMGAHALVNNGEEPVVQQEQEEPQQSPVPSPETTPLPEPDPIATPEVTPVPVTEVNEPNEMPVTESTPVTELQVAITIASAEHPDIEVVSAKVKRLGAEKVYKVTFADGWRIYVSADDGEIYIAKDNANKKHAFHNYAKKQWLKKYGAWKPWSSKYKSHCKHWIESQNWKTNDDGQPAKPSSEPKENTAVSFQRNESNDRKKNFHRSSHRHHQNR